MTPPHLTLSNLRPPSRSVSERPDALIVVPPPSPSDTNPALGPAILTAVAARNGLRVAVLDLNVRLLRRFSRPATASRLTLGDHGKDRSAVAAAAAWIFENSGLRSRPPLYLPDTADAVAGMHFSRADVSTAVASAARRPDPWRSWIEHEIRTACPRPPAVAGVSLMGPSQVFIGLLVVSLIRQMWPGTPTVLGGSHVTLLGDLLRDGDHHHAADLIMPGHCEDAFTALVAGLVRRPVGPIRSVTETPVFDHEPFEYEPRFAPGQLALYDPDRVTLPMQFSRGCSYGRCTFCTYPVVEPKLTRFSATAARAAIEAVIHGHGIRRFSLKDSLFTAPMLRAFAETLLVPPVVPIRWSATTKATRALIPLASVLARSGLATVEIGVETLSRAGQRIFDKRADPAMVSDVVLALAEHDITVVVNLIFGHPGQRLSEAAAQLDWLSALRRAAPAGRVDCSLNMLEFVRGSPLVASPPDGVELAGVAPWAFSYAWNAPPWRREFLPVLRAAELA